MDKKKIALVTGPWAKDNYSIFDTSLKLLHILEPFSGSITWAVTNGPGGDSRVPTAVRLVKLDLEDTRGRPTVLKAYYNARHQVRLLRAMRGMKDADVFVFAFGPNVLLLPVLYAKWALRKKVIFRIETRLRDTLRQAGVHPAFIWIADAVERFVFARADVIGTEYPSQAELQGMHAYREKIAVLPLYIDGRLFKITRPYAGRRYDFGYIGRLSDEKGAMGFARAAAVLLGRNKAARAVIVGRGPLQGLIKAALAPVQDRADFIDWVPPGQVPDYLNDIKLLVIPSRVEGMPNIALEAMACGTVVVASAAGGIPDIVRDNETGYLIGEPSEAAIIEGLIRATGAPATGDMIERAAGVVKSDYALETARERFRLALENISGR